MRGLARPVTGLLCAVAALVIVTLWGSEPEAQQRRAVDLELVLAIDASTSVDPQEFDLQWRGLAMAFRHPDVLGAIEAVGDLGIAVTLVQWAGWGQQSTAVDWQFINSESTAAIFSDKIARVPRLHRGFTDIAGAIRYSMSKIENNRFDGSRRVIDVSGDGTSSGGYRLPSHQRDFALSLGMIINGLVIYSDEYDLGDLANISVKQHYEDHVIGGPAAFLVEANDFEDFARAIREKLVREIIGPPVAELRGNTEPRL